ncbi:Phosphate acyltransferase [subsurface metagenome]
MVTAALFNLGKIEGVKRPALCSLIDITATEQPCLLIDSGINADCRPSHLVEFAHLGSIYARQILGIEFPRVGLLNNGEEEEKGNRLAQESHALLKKTDLNFIGNIEGQDIVKRTADVIVTDGFTGNIVLKTIEGLGDTFLFSLRQLGQLSSAAYRVGLRTLLHDIGRSSWVRKMDYREHGGACLLGVNGNVIVAHGRSQSKAIKNAIYLAKQTAERKIDQTIKDYESGIENTKVTTA